MGGCLSYNMYMKKINKKEKAAILATANKCKTLMLGGLRGILLATDEELGCLLAHPWAAFIYFGVESYREGERSLVELYNEYKQCKAQFNQDLTAEEIVLASDKMRNAIKAAFSEKDALNRVEVVLTELLQVV